MNIKIELDLFSYVDIIFNGKFNYCSETSNLNFCSDNATDIAIIKNINNLVPSIFEDINFFTEEAIQKVAFRISKDYSFELK